MGAPVSPPRGLPELGPALGRLVHPGAAGGIDALLFTGGVGERSPAIRAMAAGGLGFLGVAIDAGRNEADGPADREITAPGASVRTLVVVAREDLEIAHEVREVLTERPVQASP